MATMNSIAATRAMISVIMPSPSMPLMPPVAPSASETTQFTMEPTSAMTEPTIAKIAIFLDGAAGAAGDACAAPPLGVPAECMGGALCA